MLKFAHMPARVAKCVGNVDTPARSVKFTHTRTPKNVKTRADLCICKIKF